MAFIFKVTDIKKFILLKLIDQIIDQSLLINLQQAKI